jgi:hypothetical protein
MTDWGSVAAWVAVALGAINLCVTIAFAVMTVTQINLTRQSVERDHARRRVQATYDAVKTAMTSLSEAEPLLFNSTKKVAMENLTYDDVAQGDPRKLYEALEDLEFLAVGFRTGLFDVSVGMHLVGNFYTRMVDALMPMIKMLRTQAGHDMSYTDLEVVAEQFKRLSKATIDRKSNRRELLIDLRVLPETR